MQWSRGVSGVGLNDGLRAPAIGPEAGTFVMRPPPLAQCHNAGSYTVLQLLQSAAKQVQLPPEGWMDSPWNSGGLDSGRTLREAQGQKRELDSER